MNRESIHGGGEGEREPRFLAPWKGGKKAAWSANCSGDVVVAVCMANFLQSMLSSWNECLAGQLFVSGFLKPTCVGRLRGGGGRRSQVFAHLLLWRRRRRPLRCRHCPTHAEEMTTKEYMLFFTSSSGKVSPFPSFFSLSWVFALMPDMPLCLFAIFGADAIAGLNSVLVKRWPRRSSPRCS